jgi:branched-chain amino acid transport system permease protein
MMWGILVVIVICAVRAAYAYTHVSAGLTVEQREERMDRIGAAVQHASRLLGPLLLAFAIIFPFLPFANRQLLDIGILVVTYIMLGWGLNIVVGLAGLLDLGYVAFYAVGSYSFALLATNMGVSFWVSLPFAGLMAALAGVILGFPVLRLRGDYLAIVTLGFGEMIRIILLNWYTFTNGPDGISGIPRPSFFGIAEFKRRVSDGQTFAELFGLEYAPLQRIIFLFYLILILALIVNVFTMRIRKLPVGRAWEALREDETACRSLGINPRNTKLTAFGIGAMFGGFAGSFFATRQGFISPESFTFIESAVILAIVVLGGFGSQIGVVIAAIILIGLPEFFRELHQYRMLAFGMTMVLIMIWRPAGLLAHRDPTLRLFGGKKASEAEP